MADGMGQPRFDGQVVIVTGGGSGIGATLARLFAQQGARVVIASLGDGAPVAASIIEAGGEAIDVPTDIARPAEVRAMIETTLERFGRIDVLCNNAGIGGGGRPFWEFDDDAWQRVIDVNLTAQFLCAKYAVPTMLKQNSGVIINISSVHGLATKSGTSAYAASKAGVIGLTRGMAMDLARRNIRVNAIAPGSIDTPMMWGKRTGEDRERHGRGAAEGMPIGRIGAPEEIGHTVLFLASPAASLITGATIPVDGGLMARLATDY